MLWRKFFFDTYRCLFFTQTQSEQNPHTKSAIFSTLSSTFLSVGGDWFQGTSFLYARDHAWSNGKDALKSIALEKKIDFFIRPFSFVPPYPMRKPNPAPSANVDPAETRTPAGHTLYRIYEGYGKSETCFGKPLTWVIPAQLAFMAQRTNKKAAKI